MRKIQRFIMFIKSMIGILFILKKGKNMSVEEIKEKIRLAEGIGDHKTVQELKEELSKLSVNS